jgi:uncharacterized protein
MEALMPRDLESVIAEALGEAIPVMPTGHTSRVATQAVAAAVREYLLSDEAVQRAWGVFDAYTEDEMAMRAALAAALGEES